MRAISDPGPSIPKPTTSSTLLRALGAPLRFAVALAILARDVIVWVGRPVWRRLYALRPLALLAQWVATLPPWAVLLTLAAPIAVSEPLKVAGLYLLAIGQLKLGAILQVVGHGLSILLVERIIHAGLPQLLTYGWFAWCWSWIEAIRASVAQWPLVVATREAAARTAAQARRMARDLRVWMDARLRR